MLQIGINIVFVLNEEDLTKQDNPELTDQHTIKLRH